MQYDTKNVPAVSRRFLDPAIRFEKTISVLKDLKLVTPGHNVVAVTEVNINNRPIDTILMETVE
jgi:hypothetical protein